MSVNGAGIFHRTRLNEAEDIENLQQNILADAWKEWPNEAAFERLEEHRGPIPLRVVGNIPLWAAGSLFRAGPGQRRVEGTPRGSFHVSHWFDGFAHTHRFDIQPPSTPDAKTATVTYSSRRQSEDFVASIMRNGRTFGVSFGQRSDPCVGIFSKMMSVFKPKFTTYNVNVLPGVPGLSNGKLTDLANGKDAANLYLATDAASIQHIDASSLAPLGTTTQAAFHRDLKGPVSCAHAQRDPYTGDFFNYNLDFGSTPTYRIFRVSASTGETDILATFPAPPAYIHSFFLSENYVILCIPSSHYQWNGLGVVWHRNVVEAIQPFDKSRSCRWIVVDRRHGKGILAQFSTPAGFFFHSVNAYEEVFKDGNDEERTKVVLDYIGYENLDVIKSFYYDVILDTNDATKKFLVDGGRFKMLQPHLIRQQFTLPPQSSRSTASKGKLSAETEQVFSIPNPHAGDLPTINPSYRCKKHRYVYGLPNRGLNTVVDCIAKTDVETREAVIWAGPRGHLPGEPIFVAQPGGSEEDDGVLLSVVIDCLSEKAYLLCLDAKTMEEVGRAETEFAIGMGFHGAHIPLVG
ncbi:carotenoid oxygenase [Mariannaea sp. PMI_226]|nr:carotenoid oxygenase [Mariannaea sp. PMI_226]